MIGIFTADHHGQVSEANALFLQMIGYSLDELLGGRIRLDGLWPPDTADPRAGFPAYQTELLRKDGHRIPVTIGATLLPGSAEISVFYALDRTAQQAAEAEIRRLNEELQQRVEQRTLQLENTRAQLVQMQKLEAIGRLAGGVAHDFNNLLTAILGHSDLLRQSLSPGDGDDWTSVAEIHRAATRAAALTRQLLSFSRRQVLQPEVLDLNASLAEFASMLRRMLGEKIDLVTALGPGLGPIKFDPVALQQVIVNLVLNAREAMPAGGTITIETSETLRAVDGQRRPFLGLTVRDTGAGVRAEALDRLFEPFFTTKNQHTGLGLSTVAHIVQTSGGSIDVQSEPGQGSSFSVYLPRCEEALARAAVAPAPHASRIPAGGTVLLVEDAAELRQPLAQMLAVAGYTVLQAPGGEEALEIARKHEGPIDLVVTDVVMPGISGLELVHWLRATTPGIGAVFISGYSYDVFEQEGEPPAHTCFLAKPFPPDELLRAVRQQLARR